MYVVPTEEPAPEHVAANADCATDWLSPHSEAMAAWTSFESLPQMAPRSEGSSWVLTASNRHAGGMASTRTERARRGMMIEVFIAIC